MVHVLHSRPMNAVFLQGEKCDLRLLTPEDASERYLQWFHDEETCRYNAHHQFPMTEAALRGYLDRLASSKTELILAISEKGSGRHVGNVALQSIDWVARTAELAIIVGEKDCRGKGIGREACRLIVRHGFGALGLNRIWLGTMAPNVGMQRVAEELGFKREGVLRQANFHGGAFVDGYLYGLLASEFHV